MCDFQRFVIKLCRQVLETATGPSIDEELSRIREIVACSRTQSNSHNREVSNSKTFEGDTLKVDNASFAAGNGAASPSTTPVMGVREHGALPLHSPSMTPNVVYEQLDCSDPQVSGSCNSPIHAQSQSASESEPVENHDDQVSTPEWPNGDVEYFISCDRSDSAVERRSVGWAMVVYSHHKSKGGTQHVYLKSCLGVYKCPRCEYVERPRVSRKPHKGARPRPAKYTCIEHGLPLQHWACKATLKLIDDPQSVRILHNGFHNQAKTHAIRPTAAAKKEFKKIVLTAPEVAPKSLIIGTATRPSITDLHTSLANLERTANLRRKILSEASLKTTLEVLASFESQLSPGERIFPSSSVQALNGHICIQTKFMMERAAALESSMQTDSVLIAL